MSIKIRQFFIVIGGLVSSVILGWLLLSVAYMIPSSSMAFHVEESQRILQAESIYPSLYSGSVEDSRYDNYTTFYMLNLAVHSGDTPFFDAIKSENYFSADDNPQEGVPSALLSAISGETNAEYARYWHGYLIFLKPMLVFFSIRDIRLICQVCFFILLIVVVEIMAKKKKNGLMFGILLTLSYLLFGGAQAVETLPIFASFFLSLIGCLIIILLSRKNFDLETGKLFSEPFTLFCVFGVLGVLTAYFDFLDNPILTLCVPLALYFVLRKGTLNSRSLVSVLVCAGVGWLLSYGLMWSAKWVLAEVVAGLPVIENALRQAAFRANYVDGSFSWENAILGVIANIECLGFMRYLLGICALGALVSMAIQLLGSLVGFRECSWSSVCLMLGLLVISFLPYVWYLVLSNHSYVHAPLISYRTQIAALFPWLLIIYLTIRTLFFGDKVNSSRIFKNSNSNDSSR